MGIDLADIQSERIAHFSAIAAGMERGDLAVEVLDRLFVDMLREVW